MSKEIFHYGIPGMRWGIRRSSTKTSAKEKVKKVKNASPEQLEKAKSVGDYSSKITSEGLKINKSIGDMRSASRKQDLSKLSDAELKTMINRMNLEQQYSNLSANQVSKGQIYAKGTLEVAGSVLAIGSSALGIAIAIKQLKGL